MSIIFLIVGYLLGSFQSQVMGASGVAGGAQFNPSGVITTVSTGSGLTATSMTQTITNVALVSVVIAAANANRKGFIIYNNSANSVYMTYGATTNSATPTAILATFAHYQQGVTNYTGQISAIRNAGTGNCIFNELL